MVSIRRPEGEEAGELRELIETHRRLTGSPRAGEILARWPEVLGQFWAVVPKAAPEVVAAPAGTPGRDEKAAD
jgi:glutamate synthase domain-containing protein 3